MSHSDPQAQTVHADTELFDVPEQAYQATKLDRFFGYFVGAHFGEHYTRKDVHDINIYASMTWISAGMAATGIAIALEKYLGVPFVASFFPAAAAYTCFDRTLVRGEGLAKADSRYEKLSQPYDERDIKEHWIINSAKAFKRVLPSRRRALPLTFRLGMAACTSIITGAVIMEKIAGHEIDNMIQDKFLTNNAALIAKKKGQEEAYDGKTAALEKRIGELRTGLAKPQEKVIPTITRAPGDQARFEAASAKIAELKNQIGAAQRQLIEHKKVMDAEDVGALLPGTSGVAGRKKRWEAARIIVEGDNALLSELKTSLASEQTVIDKIAQQDRTMMAAAQQRSNTENDQIANNRQSELSTSITELTQRKTDRKATFERYDWEFKNNPAFKPKELETGPFADMRNLEDFLSNPKTGTVAVAFYRTVAGFIILLEMSALLSAALRSPTPSEMVDARRRAGVTGRIEKKVMKELEEIIPMRKKLLAMARSPWDKMHSFFRPEDGPK